MPGMLSLFLFAACLVSSGKVCQDVTFSFISSYTFPYTTFFPFFICFTTFILQALHLHAFSLFLLCCLLQRSFLPYPSKWFNHATPFSCNSLVALNNVLIICALRSCNAVTKVVQLRAVAAMLSAACVKLLQIVEWQHCFRFQLLSALVSLLGWWQMLCLKLFSLCEGLWQAYLSRSDLSLFIYLHVRYFCALLQQLFASIHLLKTKSKA